MYWNSFGAPRLNRPNNFPKSPLLATPTTGGRINCQNRMSAAMLTTMQAGRDRKLGKSGFHSVPSLAYGSANDTTESPILVSSFL